MCMAQCKRCLLDLSLLVDLEVHIWHFISSQTVYGFCQYYISSKFKIVPLILDNSYARADSKIIRDNFILYMYIWSFQYMCLEDAHFGGGDL